MYTDSYTSIFENKKTILAIFAHPDDLDIYAGGTISRLIKDGKEVYSVKMSLGNKGSRQENLSEEELSKLRLIEDKNAMNVLGIDSEHNIYLDFGDGEIETDLKSLEKIVKIIRQTKPDIVITHNPENKIIRWADGVNWINHRDHLNTGILAIDASYPYSRDLLFFNNQIKEGLQSHIVTEFLFVDYYDHIDMKAIDVTNSAEDRTRAIASHSSQYSLEQAQDSTDFFTKLDTSGKRFERFRYVVAD